MQFTVGRALSNGEWKAGTVLAGSAAEALLLWTLNQLPATTVQPAITAAKESVLLRSNPKPTLEEWNLHEYIEVAAELGVIKANTWRKHASQKNLRNFIHPAQRLNEKCARATAFSAVAGMEHIARDLS